MTILTANWAILRIYSTAACSKPAIWWHSTIVCAWRRANCKPTNFERFLFSIEKKNNAIKLYHNYIDWPYLYIVAANLCAKKRMGVCHWPMKCCRPYRKRQPKNSVRAFTHWIWATIASSKTIDDLNFCYFFLYLRMKIRWKSHFSDICSGRHRDLSFLVAFKSLHTLILDSNCTLNEVTMPYLPTLRILWWVNHTLRHAML